LAEGEGVPLLTKGGGLGGILKEYLQKIEISIAFANYNDIIINLKINPLFIA
jgi:hypothetical protein